MRFLVGVVYCCFFIYELRKKRAKHCINDIKIIELKKKPYKFGKIFLWVLYLILWIGGIYKGLSWGMLFLSNIISLPYALYNITRRIVITSNGIFEYDFFKKIIFIKYYWENIKAYKISKKDILIFEIRSNKKIKNYKIRLCEEEKKIIKKIMKEKEIVERI